MISPIAIETLRSARKVKILKGVLFLFIFASFVFLNYFQRGWGLQSALFFLIFSTVLFVLLFVTHQWDSKLVDFLQNEAHLLQKIYTKRDDGKIEIKFYSADNRVYELELGKKAADLLLQELRASFPHVEFILDHEKTFLR